MPFLSKKQARFAFATKQPWADEFAEETDFKKLPEKVKKRKKWNGGPNDEDLPWPTNIRPVGPAPIAPEMTGGSYMHNSDPYLDALGKGILPQIPSDAPVPKQEKTDKWNPYFALRGFTTGASWLGGIMERGRQDQYMMNQFAQLQQRDAIPVSNFQPTQFSQYARYGGKMAEGGSFSQEDAVNFLFEGDDEEEQIDPKVDASEEINEDFSEPARQAAQAKKDLRRQMSIDVVMGDYFQRKGAFSPRGRRGEGSLMAGYRDAPAQEVSGQAEYAFNYYQQQGLPPHIAAGIVGNLVQESQLNPNAVGDNGQARGVAQWHPDRYAGLEKWAGIKGKDVNNLNTQLDYVIEEAKQRGDLDAMKTATNSAEAAHIFAKKYERPKTIDANRIGFAKQLHP